MHIVCCNCRLSDSVCAFVLFWCSPEKVAPIVKEMLGHNLITNQTPKSGVKVRQVVNLICFDWSVRLVLTRKTFSAVTILVFY